MSKPTRLRFLRQEEQGRERVRLWCAALALGLFITLHSGILTGVTAEGDGMVRELTLEQARELAYNNNIELQLAYLALEQAALQAAVPGEGLILIELQKEMLGFEVEYLFAGSLILLEQIQLQEAALDQAERIAGAEREKEKAGYSTALAVEEAAAGIRELEAAGDSLQRRLSELLDELCLACGLTPGTELSLVPFTPVEPQPVNLDQAVADALSGRLMELRRERLAQLEAERNLAGEWYGRESLQYRYTDLAVQQARLELRQADGETRAAVRRAYFALEEKERQIGRAEADLNLGLLQERSLQAQYQAGRISAAEAAAASLSPWRKEADLVAARYAYHLAYREFDLARRGFSGSGF